tara:strand:- start:16010 stop:16144 length:135 start_codon:yes stop_codon:yes gene_type:complete
MPKKNKQAKTGAGKGSSPRNCFSKKYKDNYEQINWGNKKKKKSD